ncbi:MAG: endonuclease/exonuclease/phosphatase family protein [Mycobacterium sp.]|nr:endonuclease/exonuclease/phosphatase family protein [Mycobacterium sp.]
MPAPTEADSPRGRSRFRRAVRYAAAGVPFVTATAALTARFVPVTNHLVLALAAWFPYLLIGAAVAALLLLFTHRRYIGAVALLLTAAAAGVQIPLFVGSNEVPANTVPVRLLTANLSEGAVDPKPLMAIARDRTDLLLVQELTPQLADTLAEDGIDTAFPYKALDARPFAAGVGIWSRYPIVGSRLIPGYRLGMLSANIRVPGAADDAVVVVTHLAGPWPQPIDDWVREITTLPDTLRQVATGAGERSAIVAGDFNATYDLQPFRRLLHDGFRDAAEQSGAGLTPTFPADSVVPPLLGIDRILTLNGSTTDVQTVRIPGSDHLGLSATIHTPRQSRPALTVVGSSPSVAPEPG